MAGLTIDQLPMHARELVAGKALRQLAEKKKQKPKHKQKKKDGDAG